MGHGGKVMCEKDVVLGDIGFKKKAHWKKKLGGRGQNDKCILRRFVKKRSPRRFDYYILSQQN